MSSEAAQKITIPAVPFTVAFAAAERARKKGKAQYEKHVSKHQDKIVESKDKVVAKMNQFAEFLWLGLGFVLVLHGVQFKNMFLCTQVIVTFCYERLYNKSLALYNHLTTGMEKKDEDEKEGDVKKEEDEAAVADAKKAPGNKHAKKRAQAGTAESAKKSATQEEDAAATKEALKSLDAARVSEVVFEYLMAFAACHMAMEGGLGTVVVVAHALAKTVKPKLEAQLDYSDCEDMKEWADLFISFFLYAFFGVAAVLAPSLALTLNVVLVGAQLLAEHGLRMAQSRGKVEDAEQELRSTKGLAIIGGLVLFGFLKQIIFSGMYWVFSLIYIPAIVAEAVVSIF